MAQLRWGRYVGLAVLATVIGAGLVGGYLWYQNKPDAMLQDAESNYADGKQALEKDNLSRAAKKLDEAAIQASKAAEGFGRELQQPKERTPEMVQDLRSRQGRALLIKSRALRDLAFARAKEENKPLKETTDSITGDTFRSLLVIPDEETRKESFACLRLAADRLPDDVEVQNELLRAEVMLQPVQWSFTEPLCERIIKIDPNNVRAQYHLARYHFDQPIVDTRGGQSGPTPPEKRKLDRMMKAREHVEKAKQSPNSPFWRTLDLETQITLWLRDEHKRQGKTAKVAPEERKLHEVLLDDKNGVVAVARRDAKVPEMAIFDLRGALHLHLLGLKTLVEEAGRGEATADKVLAHLDATLELCERVAKSKASTAAVQDAAAAAVEAVTIARPALTAPTPRDWDARLDRVQALGQAALDRKVKDPSFYAEITRLFDREALLASKIGEQPRRQRCAKASDAWIDNGLQVCIEEKAAPVQVADLHALAAHRKALRGEKPENYEPHLKALRDTQLPLALSLAAFLEGIVAERAGRLERARKQLELARSHAPGDLRINLALGIVNLSLNDPKRALPCLETVARRYHEIDQLPEQDRNWAKEFLRDREELDYLLVVSHLGTAQARLAAWKRENPTAKTVPNDVMGTEEEASLQVIKKMQPRGARSLAARRAYIGYLSTTGRRDKARTELRMLQADHPGSLDLLQVELALLDPPAARPGRTLDPDFVAKVDDRIQRFLTDYPTEIRGKLFWAAWLAESGRADKAIAYLENPTNFGTKDDSYQRVLALALLRKGDRAGSQEILRHLPNSAGLDAALIQLETDPEKREQQLKDAIGRHEQNGLLACLDGAMKLGKQQYAEAADAYFKALEFTQVRAAAESGLQRALVARAGQDPLGAQTQILALAREAPEQPALYLAYALVCVQTGEMGRPDDTWDRKRSLSSALNLWEQLHVTRGGDPVAARLTRSECWVLANRFDLAQQEVRQALVRDPKNERALSLGITLALDVQGPGALQTAREYLNTLKGVNPDGLTTALLEARVLEREGKGREAIALLETTLDKHKKPTQAQAELQALLERTGDKTAAQVQAQRWLSDEPKNLAAAGAVVQWLAQAGQLDKAREAARKAVDVQLEQAKEQSAKAKKPESLSTDDWEKKKQEYLDTIRKASEYAITGAFVRGKAWSEAQARLTAMLEKDPKNEAAQLLLGEVYLGQEEWKKAVDLYAKLMEGDGKQVIAANNLAWVLAEKLNETARAYEIVEKLRRNPHTQQPLGGDRLRPEILDTVGVVYSKMNQPEVMSEMKNIFEAATVRYPSDPRMRLYLGNACVGLKDSGRARQNYLAAITLASPDAHHTLTPAERAKVRKEAEEALKRLGSTARQ